MRDETTYLFTTGSKIGSSLSDATLLAEDGTKDEKEFLEINTTDIIVMIVNTDRAKV